MRNADVAIFEYASARDPDQGTCVGLFNGNSFVQKKPKDKNQWLCELSTDTVSFKEVSNNTIITFHIDDFYYEGHLPLPA